MWELVEKIFVVIKILAGFVIVEFIVVMSQMAVHGQSSKPRGSMVADTWWAGLALMRCLQPS